jgi:tetratricopeptide (TPR) repeat protein
MTADRDDAHTHLNRGNGLADKESFEEAIAEYRKAYELWEKDQSKDRKFALSKWANALRELENYDEAVKKYNEAIGLDADWPDGYFQLGRVLADQELFEQAIEQYGRADEKWQKAHSQERKCALSYWGDALREQEDYKQAAEMCLQAIQIDPDYPEAHNFLGQVRAAQGRFDEAIEEYSAADEKWQKKGSKDKKMAFALLGERPWRAAVLRTGRRKVPGGHSGRSE